MAKYYSGKHYKGETSFDSRKTLEKTVTLRLSENEMKIIKTYFPNNSISYAIRSIINSFERTH